MVKCIKYQSGYKYQIVEDYSVQLEHCLPGIDYENDFLELSTDNILTIKAGYASDGPSGPTIDTPTFMRGAFVHDALYQLMREGVFDEDTYRKQADRELRKLCREDGMSAIRAAWVYAGVRVGGGASADPAHKRPVLTSPENCEE